MKDTIPLTCPHCGWTRGNSHERNVPSNRRRLSRSLLVAHIQQRHEDRRARRFGPTHPEYAAQVA